VSSIPLGVAAVKTRRFRIEVGACRRCGRERPTHLELCKECAATIGEPRLIPCARVVPPVVSRLPAPALVVAIAVELSRRQPPPDDGWAARLWGKGRSGVRGCGPGEAGAGRIDHCGVVARALRCCGDGGGGCLGATAAPRARVREKAELRGGIALGVAGVGPKSDAVERCAERLALAAAAGQWLVSHEVARRLQERFQLSPVGIVPRWPMPFVASHRALIARLAPPALPSAISGEVPGVVLGRVDERRRLSAEIASAVAGRRRVALVSAPAGGRQVLSAAAGAGRRGHQAGGGRRVPAPGITSHGPVACAAGRSGPDEDRLPGRASGGRPG
jgi:hypothetical protein